MSLFIIFDGDEPCYYTDDRGHAHDMVSDLRLESPDKVFTLKVLQVDLAKAVEV